VDEGKISMTPKASHRRFDQSVHSVAPTVGSSVSEVATELRSWSKMVAQGESQKVMAEAEAMGFRSCFGQCSGADLRALADAARYSGRLDVGEAALRALRDRFPSQSAVAEYLLGTVDEARGRNASALRWYEEYVAAAPRGAFASEALAGRLRMMVATNGYSSARKAAEEYLAQYPNGVGARTAKQVLQGR
jgi:TolA-binding protein